MRIINISKTDSIDSLSLGKLLLSPHCRHDLHMQVPVTVPHTAIAALLAVATVAETAAERILVLAGGHGPGFG